MYQQIADLFGLEVPKDDSIPKPGVGKLEGKDSEENTLLGGQNLSEGNYEAAIKHFQKAIELNDGAPTAEMLMNLGGAFETAAQEPQALRQYRQALKQSNTVEPHVAVADLYKRSGRWRDSIKELQQALEISPYDAYTNHKISEIYKETGYYAQALEFAQRSVVGAPGDSYYHQWMADILLLLERYEDALKAFRAAIELSPGDEVLYVRASIAFWKLGKYQEAVKAVRLASDLNPDDLMFYGLLSVYLNRMEMQDESRMEAEKAKKMDEYDRERLRRLCKEIGFEDPV
jgi:tetratricopeptide (TPR) repeat protein